MKVGAYWKGIIAGLAPVLIAVQAAVTDGVVTTAEWVTVGLAVAAAAGVVAVPNAPKPPVHEPAADRASERPNERMGYRPSGHVPEPTQPPPTAPPIAEP